MVIHAGQHCGAGGGGSGVYKIDTIKLVIAGNSIGVDLRGAALPTPKPRPVMTLMWHPDGFTQSDLHKVMEKAYQWSYARNIGVLSRVVCFTLDEMDPDYVSAHPEFQEGSDHVPNEGEISSVVSVSGELAEFHAFIQEDFGEWNVGLPEPHIELLLHS